jgi:hypothetical protein
MRIISVALTIAIVACASIARASEDSELMAKVGLLGSWALDCRKPASENNLRHEYSQTLDGALIRTRNNGDPAAKTTLTVKDVRIMGGGKIGMIHFHPNGEVIKIVVLKIGQRYRGWDAVVQNTGKRLADDGLLPTGEETSWYSNCDAL